ncbi:hypothetical protein HK104_005194 [Borealophlyctis nickersoniae]|nr:hypothetical protein HK104_005194 [Borealophlyctis nickersoniae]
MECLKMFHELSIMSSRLDIPFLKHFFKTFDPAHSKSLSSSITHFHLRDLESADYRSAYHQLCDWFYGWNVTDATEFGVPAAAGNAGAVAEHFKMKRVPRDIHIEEDGERVECDRIMKTFETLFSMSRRVLKKQYMDIEEQLPRIGQGLGTMSNVGKGGGAPRDGGDEDEGHMDEVEKVWAKARMKSDENENETGAAEREAGEGSTDSLDKDSGDLLKASRPAGMVVRRKTQAVLDGTKEMQRTSLSQEENDGVSRASTPSEPGADGEGSGRGTAEVTGKHLPIGALPPEGFSMQAPVHRGVLRQGPDEDDVRRVIQRDINHVFGELDRSTEFTLICLANIILVLSFSQLLEIKDNFIKFLSSAHELSMDFVSNTLKTVWDLLNRELPGDVSLRDIRDLSLLRAKLNALIQLRARNGRVPKYRYRKLYHKFGLLHDIFTAVDVHLFPNFVVAHKEGVKCARFSAFDSAMWLTGGYDCAIRIHDVRQPVFNSLGEKVGTGHTCLAQYVGHKSIVTDVRFTRDDRHIISSSFDRTIKIWNAQSASCERTLNGHVDSVTSCDVTPDGRYIASGSTDCSIRLWDVNNGACVAVIKKHLRWVKVVRFSHDGRYLASAGLDRRIYIWDLKILVNSRAISHTRCIEAHSDSVLDMATARPTLLVTTSRDSTVRLFDYVTGHELITLDLAPSWACTVCFSENGEYFAAGSFDNNVVIWRTKDCAKVRQIRVLNLGIMSVRFPKDLSYIAVGTTEGFLQQIPL